MLFAGAVGTDTAMPSAIPLVSGGGRRHSSTTATTALIVAAILLGITVPVVVSGAARAAAGFPTPRFVARWSPLFMETDKVDHQLTTAEAKQIASRFDVIVAQAGFFDPDQFSGMRSANPRMRLLVYVDGMLSDNDPGGTLWPNAWYAHDSNGNKITTRQPGDHYLMNPANTGWGGKITNDCSDGVAMGYDGCFLDSMGLAPFSTSYATGRPINPSTGQVWTEHAWLNATDAVGQRVNNALGTALVVLNGLGAGWRYQNDPAATSALLKGVDGAMAELFVRAPHEAIQARRSETMWKYDVDMLVDAGMRGKSLVVTTKTWTTSTQPQRDTVHKYALATFLLGTNGKSFFSFVESDDYDSAIADSAYDRVNVGTPRSPYAKVDGLYRRNFTNGVAVVNPTSSPASTVLDGFYTDLAGNVHSGNTFVAPGTGDVFTPVN